MNNGPRKAYYYILPGESIEQVGKDSMYQRRSRGFVRQALIELADEDAYDRRQTFKDPEFTMSPSREYLLARVSDLYDLDSTKVPLFNRNEPPNIMNY